ncbi:hypothetical protein RI129_007585 [Pyrocoelia pectoralis]|uniref:Cytochrome P450 n=1 Tax=Pyrocoelia pectoralis TaxID=417401 RepID=A0AAN7V8A8_9COLE
MKAMFALIKETSQQYVSYLKSQGNEVIEVQLKDIFERFTIDVITNVAFGIKTDSLSDRNNTFYTLGKKIAQQTGIKGFILFNAFPAALSKLIRVPVYSKEIREFFTAIVNESIELREKSNIIRPDVLHLLMESRKGPMKVEEEIKDIPDEGFAVVEESGYDQGIEQIKMTNEMITAQALIFFLAGFETISMLLSHTIYELVINPDIQQKLRKELEETLLKSQGKLTYESVMRMQYLDMIISETLRKWPPFVVSDRKSTKPYVIEAKHPGESDVHVEKDSIIFIPTYCIQMDPNNFSNPDKYDPERFSPENRKKIKECTYIPFGFGPRNCIGSRFALMEAKLALVEIIENFEIVRISKSQIPLVIGKRSYNLVPDCGFWVGLKPR